MKTFVKKMSIGIGVLAGTGAVLAGITWFICLAPEILQVVIIGLLASFGIGHLVYNFYINEVKPITKK